ncbi:MAG: hypothetical protein IKS51_01000 [Erysipelotrichaceae bacterium]|nr:hypothetical protein [Erysipelotrichaceae bacterium]
MRYLYYGNSAYQLLNILNLHHQRQNGFESIPNYEADLIMQDSFDGVKELCEIVKGQKIFKTVRLAGKKDTQGSIPVLSSLTDIVFPKRYLSRYYQINDAKDLYDVIATPKFMPLIAAIWQLNPKAELHLLEDGAGSYFSYFDLEMRSKSYKWFYKLFNHGKDFYAYKKIYINEPDLYFREDKDKVVPIPKFDKDHLKEVQKLFRDFLIDYPKQIDIYWLSQNLSKRKGKQSFDCEEALQSLERYPDRVLYCPHPRNPENDTIFLSSDPKQIWELQVLNTKQIEKKLIISIHSTACLTPKILFDKEPYVILLYRIVIEHDWKYFEMMEKVIEAFIRKHRDPDKVMIPSTLEEYEECLKRFLASGK